MKKAKPVPVVGKAYTFAEVLAQANAMAKAEQERRAKMTPEEQAAEMRKDEMNEAEIQEILKKLPGVVRLRIG